MYNGVGLTTPRGSGTSGYVQKNLAYIQRPTTRADFQKELAAIKANPPKPPKKPNPEIIEHEQKRQIEIHLIHFKKSLEAQNLPQAEILSRIENARTHLYTKLHEAPLLSQSSSHGKVLQKEEEIEKFRETFGIKNDYIPGSSFNFEALEEKRQKENEERANKKKLKKLDELENREKERLQAIEDKKLDKEEGEIITENMLEKKLEKQEKPKSPIKRSVRNPSKSPRRRRYSRSPKRKYSRLPRRDDRRYRKYSDERSYSRDRSRSRDRRRRYSSSSSSSGSYSSSGYASSCSSCAR